MMPSDRSRRPTDAPRSGSSSITNTVEFASDIAAARKRSRKSAFCLVYGRLRVSSGSSQ
jgi:hypothetical protein